jgi:hypothetical protein
MAYVTVSPPVLLGARENLSVTAKYVGGDLGAGQGERVPGRIF